VLTVYRLKPAFQRILRPWVGWLARRRVTPNGVTVAAFVLCLAYGAVMAATPASPWILLLMPAVLLARMVLNAMDGMLAREYGQASRLGAALNELGDVAGDAALYLPLALVPGFPSGLVVVLVVLAALAEMAGVMVQAVGRQRSYKGPMGKSDRAAVLAVIAFVVGIGIAPGWWLDPALALIVALLLVTIANRVRDGLSA
jgi:phosphatidylglycerophosphate synthase